MEQEKIGVYGGTFNPPHLGHMTAARLAVDVLGLSKLLMIPAALPPHKELPEDAPSAAHRLEMTRIAADCLGLKNRVEVSKMELERPGKSYSADTLAQLRQTYPEAELWFLMGEDMLLSLEHWRAPGEIMKKANLAAFARSGNSDRTALEAQAKHLRNTYQARVEILDLDKTVEISSTQLRTLLAQGEGQAFLAPSVYGYLLRNDLYNTHADLKNLSDEDLRACSYSMVKAKRIPHIRGTEEEAVKLAHHWGADIEAARRAAILHDCTKYLDLDEQLQLCNQYGIVLDDLEQKAVKLLHSKTGAHVAKTVYGAGCNIFDAIFWHTTGKADMTTLEKILYLADYMEPTRDFDGVERLRALAYTNLDGAVLLGCEMSVAEMEERGQPVHHRTLEARAWLRGALGEIF